MIQNDPTLPVILISIDQNGKKLCFDVFALQLSQLACPTSQDIDDPPCETWPLSTAATSVVPWIHPVRNGRLPMFKQTTDNLKIDEVVWLSMRFS